MASGPPGTLEKPTEVPSAFGERIVGCVCKYTKILQQKISDIIIALVKCIKFTSLFTKGLFETFIKKLNVKIFLREEFGCYLFVSK